MKWLQNLKYNVAHHVLFYFNFIYIPSNLILPVKSRGWGSGGGGGEVFSYK